MSQNFTQLSTIRGCIQHVLPLVFDNSLSYYELLAKVLDKVNVLIENQNLIPDYVKELISEYIESGKIGDIIRDIISDYMLNVQSPPDGTTGATPDGSTDSTEAFQACIDYAYARGGGAVYVPYGRYLIQSLEMKDNVCLIGFDRYSTVIVAKGGITKPLIYGNVENISIQNIGVDGNMDIQVNNVNAIDLTVKNALFNNLCVTDGYKLLNLTCNGGNVQIANVDFGHAVTSALDLHKGTEVSTITVSNITISDISVLKGEYAILSEIDGVMFDAINITTNVPTGVIINANHNSFRGHIYNANVPFVDSGDNNNFEIIGVTKIEKMTGTKNVTVGSSSETVEGMKVVNVDSIKETVKGYKETSSDSTKETVTTEKIVNAGSIKEVVEGAKTISAKDFVVNTEEPMTYGEPFNISDTEIGVKYKDKNGKVYNVLVYNENVLKDKTKRNVIEFGAVGDGVTDNTTAFQNAIDWLADNGGGLLFVPSGVYRVNNTLYLKSFVSIVGEQERKTVIKYYGANDLFNSANENMNGVVFGNLTLQKNGAREGAGFLGGSTLENYNSALITFFNLCIIGFNDGIKGNAETNGVGIFDSTFVNVWVSDCNNGFHCFGSQNTFVNPRLTNCMQGFNFDYLNEESCDGAIITGGVFVNNDYDILVPKIDGVRPITFNGTWFENSKYGLINAPNANTKHMGFVFNNCMINSRCEANQLLINANNFANEILFYNCLLYKTIETANTSFNNSVLSDCYEKDMTGNIKPVICGRYITPQMFGAKGNGANDSEAFASWLKYIIENGKTGFIPDGIYKIESGGISYRDKMNKPFSIIGQSTENTILYFPLVNPDAQPNCIDLRYCDNFTLKNFTIKCCGANYLKSGVALYLVDCNHAKISDIEITDCSRGGVTVYSATYTEGTVCEGLFFENVNIYGKPNTATHGDTGRELYPMGWILSDCVNSEVRRSNIYDLMWYGFEFKNYCRNSFFIDCNARRCVTACHIGAELREGDIFGTVGCGFINVNCYDVDTPITGGTFRECVFDGINCYYSDGFTFKGGTQYTARLQDCINNYFRASMFNIPYGGIMFSGNSDNNSFTVDYVSVSSDFVGRVLYAVGDDVKDNLFVVKGRSLSTKVQMLINEIGNNVVIDEMARRIINNSSETKSYNLMGADTPNKGNYNESAKVFSKTFYSEDGKPMFTFGNLSGNYLQLRADVNNNRFEIRFVSNGETKVVYLNKDGTITTV